jgi:hypothetical protein
MTIDVIVARYKEDLMWTKTVQPGKRILVYNKCGIMCNSLPNVGREAHTYLHHILHEYRTLPDWTFFTQGDPNAHLPRTRIQTVLNGFPDNRLRSVLMLEGGPIFFVDEPVRPLEADPQNEDAQNDVRGLWDELFKSPFPEDILFAPAAIFAIHKSNLYTRSMAFYHHAMNAAARRPRGPWEFERLWAYLWRAKDTPRL